MSLYVFVCVTTIKEKRGQNFKKRPNTQESLKKIREVKREEIILYYNILI